MKRDPRNATFPGRREEAPILWQGHYQWGEKVKGPEFLPALAATSNDGGTCPSRLASGQLDSTVADGASDINHGLISQDNEGAMAYLKLLFALIAFLPLMSVADIGDCIDGNICFVDEAQYKGQIKLYCTRAPELNEPYGFAARNALRAEVYGTIRVLIDHIDRKGRPVAELIRDDGLNLGLNLVRLGLAKVDDEGCDDPIYGQTQIEAKRLGLGVWK